MFVSQKQPFKGSGKQFSGQRYNSYGGINHGVTISYFTHDTLLPTVRLKLVLVRSMFVDGTKSKIARLGAILKEHTLALTKK